MILSLAKCRTEDVYLECLNRIRSVYHERKHEFAAYLFLHKDVKKVGESDF